MAKARVQFLCNSCGSVHPKWLGKCPDCNAWDTLEQYKEPTADPRAASRQPLGSRGAAIGGDAFAGAQAVAIDEIDDADTPRTPCGISEFDRVLGGGVVPGSAVLVGGEPGIGKSTLLLQVAHQLAKGSDKVAKDDRKKARRPDIAPGLPGETPEWAAQGKRVLYVTSEESARQTKLRGSRLGAGNSNLLVLAETNLERIIGQIHKVQPAVVVIDSIQMIYKPDLPAAPGSVTQLRDCCMELVYLAKATGIAIMLVGHVTKAGTLAGPKIVEHIVDTVVYFEGDRYHAHRIVRCVKNRFGSTHEVGLFEMTGEGLREVLDPGNLFLEHYGPQGQPSGSVITAAMQGSRVLLVEVQALTASSVIGAARRKVSGVSADRVGMIIAVLEKRAEMRLAADDVFVNVAGGVKIAEPAADLAIALAIASAHMNKPLATGTLAIGELGLGGEIRSVPQLETRLREASRLGLGHGIIPHMGETIPKLGGMALHEVRRLSQAMGNM
ncbi:MAG TPA: DNA repair protein RadA [Tepidisphaeraceae bacterium]|jgi:DNA repair protein RadA/Sms|nr:DNA repair protein RadA [Tepidisphaeraceae bacterium]